MSQSGNLPRSWARVRLGDVVPYGETEKVEPVDIPADAWMLELEDIEKDTSRLIERATYADRKPKSTKNRFRRGDVLYGKLRPYLNKVLIADRDGYCTTEIVPIHTPKPVDGRYLFYWLKHPEFLKYVAGVSHGLNMPRLGTEAGRNAPFILAPLEEQRRIARTLDSLFDRLARCRQRLGVVSALLKGFREAVLDAAVSGSLTEEWRSLHPALIDATDGAGKVRKRHDDAGGHQKGNAAPPSNNAHDLEQSMFPEGWDLVELRELVEPDRPITYGILKPGDDLPDGIRYVRVADYPNNMLNILTVRRTSPVIEQQFARSRLREGDLLLSIRGTVGRVIEIPKELERANITQDSARLSVQRSVDRRYVLWFLRSRVAQVRMQRAVKGVAVRGINIGDVRALQVPLPSQAEQQEIVRRTEILMAMADSLEHQVLDAISRVSRLVPSILAKAFQGRLIPQDPGEERGTETQNGRKVRGAKTSSAKSLSERHDGTDVATEPKRLGPNRRQRARAVVAIRATRKARARI